MMWKCAPRCGLYMVTSLLGVVTRSTKHTSDHISGDAECSSETGCKPLITQKTFSGQDSHSQLGIMKVTIDFIGEVTN